MNLDDESVFYQDLRVATNAKRIPMVLNNRTRGEQQ